MGPLASGLGSSRARLAHRCGPLGFAKALDQLIVLSSAELKIGHISTMVGVNSIRTGTQPPGILAWAAFTAYNRTRDKRISRNGVRGVHSRQSLAFQHLEKGVGHQRATNDVWTGAVDVAIVNVVGRSVSHTLTWVVRPVHCVVVHILT